MTISINDKVCKENGITVAQLLALLLVKTGENIPKLLEELKSKEMIVEEQSLLEKTYTITQRWDDVCCNVILSSDKDVPIDTHIEELAKALMELYPKGKKPGTNTYWRGNLKDTKLRLKKFYKLYGNKYTDTQILEATKKYIEDHIDLSYMRVLKYFIWKDVRKVDSEGVGYIEETSDLASYIENEGQTEDNWLNEVK
jgi:hypothetical protein